jgi:adenosylcobinamide-phosphate synthase
VEVALLWTTISMRGLADVALAVERELERGDLGAARFHAGEIVGRDKERLSEGEVARAAVESVAENASDGVVAPMLYGLLFGAPGALAYKAINTLDSMVGHPHPPHKDLGRAPPAWTTWRTFSRHASRRSPPPRSRATSPTPGK